MRNRASYTPTVLGASVVRKVIELGDEAAAAYFGVAQIRVRGWRTGAMPIPLWAADKVFLEKLDRKDERASEGVVTTLDWGGKDVMLCLPWYKFVSPSCAFSTLALYNPESMRVAAMFGDAFISHTRNKLANVFLESGCQWSMWIDDDMILPIGKADWFNKASGLGLPEASAGLHTINRLLSHRKTIVGGLYFGRSKFGRPMYAEGASDVSEAAFARHAPHDIVKPTRWVATGCLLVHRSVFEDIERKFPKLGRSFFSPSEHDLVESVDSLRAVLSDLSATPEDRVNRALSVLNRGAGLAKANSRLGTGEDVIFCTRAAEAGHQPHVDLGLVCGHVGSEVFGPRNTMVGEDASKF